MDAPMTVSRRDVLKIGLLAAAHTLLPVRGVVSQVFAAPGAADAKFPQVREALLALRRESPLARMSGSGACVFAPFIAERDARKALERLPAGTPGRVVRTVARHPLASFAS